MVHILKYGLAALSIFLALSVSTAGAVLPTVMEEKDILPYLEKMITWHNRAGSLDVSSSLPREWLLKSSLQQHTVRALKGSFSFAHALAVIQETVPKQVFTEDAAKTASGGQGIIRAISGEKQRIQQLQDGLESAKTARSRDKLSGELKLSQEHLSLLRTIAQTAGAHESENETLEQKISQLESTVPEIDGDQQKTPGDESSVMQNAVPRLSSGLFGLITEIYSFAQSKSAVKSLLTETKNLREDSRKYSQVIREGVKGIMQQGNTLGDKAGGKGRASPQPTYDDLVSDMRKLSKAAVALSQTGVALDACSRDLSGWADLISQRLKELAGHLFFRLTMLLTAIFAAVCVAMLARRATHRYVLDARRRHQMRVVRKVALAVVIGLIVFLGFFTDLGSLATFSGLLMAGLAVALQNVILSLIAYFHFFGHFGIRTGDRITISGVTGKVMQIGILRFYLMELEKSDLRYLPTGRIVGFTNAILFQPTPFFRQTPGTNFVWSEITLTLAPSIDHEGAYKKLYDVVQRVYAEHSDAIRQQEEMLQNVTHFKAEVSVPQIYLKITSAGLAMIIHYAVEREQQSAMQVQMTEELVAAIKKDPALKVVNIS